MEPTNYTELIPRGAVKRIYEKSGMAVSYRQVLRILSGECSDAHGIIDLAIEEAKQFNKKKEKQMKQTALLQSSPSSSSNQ